MGSEELITIVIPIYNMEKYLDRCLQSVINQTYTELDIVLVDDGSFDDSPAKCDEWAKKDSRVRVFHKINEGLGMARNTGIENARGRYICFFDSDDYVKPDTIEKAYKSIKKYKTDIVMFGMYLVDPSGKIIGTNIPHSEKEVYYGIEVMDFILPNMLGADPKTGRELGFNMSSSGRMFSMELIERCEWRFVSERKYISEDFYSLLQLHKYIKSISIIHEPFYYYCYNENSLSHIFDPQRFKKLCFCYKEMIKLCEKNKYSNEVKKNIYSQFLGSVISTMKMIVSSDLTVKEQKKEIKAITTDVFLKETLSQLDIKKETFSKRVLITIIKKEWSRIAFVIVKVKK